MSIKSPAKENSKNNSNELHYQFEVIATAHHEAGHTISGLLNFMMIPSVSIEVTKKRKFNADLGFTHFQCIFESYDAIQDNELFLMLLMAEIEINYAGLAAEKILYKNLCGSSQLPMVLKHGSKEDRDNISNIIKKYNLAPAGAKRFLFKRKALQKSLKALEVMWDDIQLVSHALYKKRKLYHDDLKELLTKKSINKKFWKEQFKKISILFESSYLDETEIKYIFLSS